MITHRLIGRRAFLGAGLAFLGTGGGAPFAQAAEVLRGPVTNLPVPRYVSMKAERGNVRRGPSQTHRVDWVFTQRNMPLRITAEFQHWRRVQDWEGEGGWMHFSLLSGVRTVLVVEDYTPLRLLPDTQAAARAYAEHGVIARLGECTEQWCRISVDGRRGWVQKSALWGVAPEETRRR
ncbi:MAG: aspartyl-trna synthetase [Rhodobacteraceae bacterium]|nr:aspartyl-trna synthetase [Paracoccaceae bacterium]